MPNYGMPGVAIDRRGAHIIGVAFLALVTAVASSWFVLDKVRDDDRLQIVLQTEQIGDGIGAGTQVRLDGVNVGTIEKIDSAERGRQLITLRLQRSQLFGVTDSLVIDYAPSNLFGISEIELKPGPGGAPLRDGDVVDLTAAHADRVHDATMGSLIRSLSQTTNGVLTPQLTDTLTTVAADLKAFTPLLEALITTGRSVADTQRYASSFLLGQYGSALSGSAPLIGATIELFDTINKIEILRNQRDLYDTTVQTVIDQLFPAVSNTLFTAQPYFSGYTAMLTPILRSAAAMVPTPGLSSGQLRTILQRLDTSFTDTPEGPMLDLALTLHGVPALSVPLQAVFPAQSVGGGR